MTQVENKGMEKDILGKYQPKEKLWGSINVRQNMI